MVSVYLREAHAQDEWPISSARACAQPVLVTQPRTDQARLQVARKCCADIAWRLPMVVDPAHGKHADAFETLYAAWPIRFYVLRRRAVADAGLPPSVATRIGRATVYELAFIAQPREATFDLAEIQSATTQCAEEASAA